MYTKHKSIIYSNTKIQNPESYIIVKDTYSTVYYVVIFLKAHFIILMGLFLGRLNTTLNDRSGFTSK